jgi:hypothetical protein
MSLPLPTHFKAIIPLATWESWGHEQQAHVIARDGQAVTHSDYPKKQWGLGAARPEVREICAACQFEYCFYALPRNWSVSHTADVWNLMECANARCQQLFEACS